MLPLLRHAFTRRIFATLIFELVALNCCFIFLVQARVEWWEAVNDHLFLTGLFAMVNTFVVQFALWSFRLYSREVVYSGDRLTSNLIGAFVCSAILLFPTSYLFGLLDVPMFSLTKKFYLFALLGFTSVIAVERFFVLKIFRNAPYLGNLIILGTGKAAEKVLADAETENGATFRLGGILSEDPREVGREILGHRVMGVIQDLGRLLPVARFDTVLLATSAYSPSLPVTTLLRAKVTGTRVLDAGDFYEARTKKILLERLEPIQLLLSDNLRMTRFRWILKDSMEKLVAVLLLAATWPIMVAAAIAIKLTSCGPILYKQTRTGKDGRPFTVYKFRTMCVDAEKGGKPQWAQKNDPRVTLVGRIMRKTRIDELPQIFNVLGGTMAFVGPRPERPEFVAMLEKEIPFYDQRHLVKPGVTGWAQVCYPYGASVDDAREKLAYDLYYIKHMSLFFDLLIVLATVRTVLFKSYGR